MPSINNMQHSFMKKLSEVEKNCFDKNRESESGFTNCMMEYSNRSER